MPPWSGADSSSGARETVFHGEEYGPSSSRSERSGRGASRRGGRASPRRASGPRESPRVSVLRRSLRRASSGRDPVRGLSPGRPLLLEGRLSLLRLSPSSSLRTYITLTLPFLPLNESFIFLSTYALGAKIT